MISGRHLDIDVYESSIGLMKIKSANLCINEQPKKKQRHSFHTNHTKSNVVTLIGPTPIELSTYVPNMYNK